MDRVRVIDGSLRCYACGWASLVPLVGLAGCAVAIAEFVLTKRISRGDFNPARKYLWGGLMLAVLGGLLNVLPFLLLCRWTLTKIADGSFSWANFP